jgi:hypothetical protein
MGVRNSVTISLISGVDVHTLNQFAKFLARFEEGNLLRRHFDSGSGFRIAPDARSSLARAETSESADFNLVAGSQGTDDAVKYGANDDVGFLPGHLGGLTNLFNQISPGHLAHPRCITKESITLFLGALGASLWLRPSSSPSGHLAFTSIASQDCIREPQETLSAGTIALEIPSRNARVAALQKGAGIGCVPAST